MVSVQEAPPAVGPPADVPLNRRVGYSFSEFAKLLGVKRQTVFQWFDAGHVQAEMIGDRYVISVDEARRVLALPREMLVLVQFPKVGNGAG